MRSYCCLPLSCSARRQTHSGRCLQLLRNNTSTPQSLRARPLTLTTPHNGSFHCEQEKVICENTIKLIFLFSHWTGPGWYVISWHFMLQIHHPWRVDSGPIANNGNCLLFEWAATAVCHCSRVEKPANRLLDRRHTCIFLWEIGSRSVVSAVLYRRVVVMLSLSIPQVFVTKLYPTKEVTKC